MCADWIRFSDGKQLYISFKLGRYVRENNNNHEATEAVKTVCYNNYTLLVVWGKNTGYSTALKRSDSMRGNTDAHGNMDAHGNTGVHGNRGVYGNTDAHGNTGVYGNTDAHGNTGEHGNMGVHGNTGEHGNTGVYGNTYVPNSRKVSRLIAMNTAKIECAY